MGSRYFTNAADTEDNFYTSLNLEPGLQEYFLPLRLPRILTGPPAGFLPDSTVSAWLPFFLKKVIHLFSQSGRVCCPNTAPSMCNTPGTVEPWGLGASIWVQGHIYIFVFKDAVNFVQILLLSETVNLDLSLPRCCLFLSQNGCISCVAILFPFV